jgi:hypothetical protein
MTWLDRHSFSRVFQFESDRLTLTLTVMVLHQTMVCDRVRSIHCRVLRTLPSNPPLSSQHSLPLPLLIDGYSLTNAFPSTPQEGFLPLRKTWRDADEGTTPTRTWVKKMRRNDNFWRNEENNGDSPHQPEALSVDKSKDFPSPASPSRELGNNKSKHKRVTFPHSCTKCRVRWVRPAARTDSDFFFP